MKKYLSTVCALALAATMFTACGCSNSGKDDTMLPTNATMAPTTQATTAPTTHPTTAPTTMPTTEAPTQSGDMENGGSGTDSTGGSTNGSTEATGHAGAKNRMPAPNGQ